MSERAVGYFSGGRGRIATSGTFWAALAITFASCGSDDGASPCVPGATQPCECFEAPAGAETCNAAGRFSGCDCGGGSPTGLCPASGCGDEDVRPYLEQALAAAGASLTDGDSVRRVWDEPGALSDVILETLVRLDLADGQGGSTQKAACNQLETYNDSVQYCGRGCSVPSGSDLLTTHPGMCLNRACFAHDACYAAYECAGKNAAQGKSRTVGLDCVFSAATDCCDEAMDDTADACEANGDGNRVANLPSGLVVGARVLAETGSLRAAADAVNGANDEIRRAAQTDAKFHMVRLLVTAMRGFPRAESCVGQLEGAATCNEQPVSNDCKPRATPSSGSPPPTGSGSGGGGAGVNAICSHGGGANDFDCCMCSQDDRLGWQQCVQNLAYSGSRARSDFEGCCRAAGGQVVSTGATRTCGGTR